jgi:Ca-activated chloride channel family protein
LQKAKRLVSQLVDKMENDKVGMIVFAGDAFTQLPITSDYISAKMFLETIDPSLISKQGTALGAAINLSTRSFTPMEGVGRTVILITDGENHEDGALEAAKAAVEKGIQINVLGVGMPEGAPIPIPGSNDYRRDREGNVVVTKLNEQMCQEIAQVGQGIYVRVDNSNAAQNAITKEINKLAKADVETQVYTEFNEQFQAIAWIILLLLLVEMLILERKNPLFKNIHLFSDKKK